MGAAGANGTVARPRVARVSLALACLLLVAGCLADDPSPRTPPGQASPTDPFVTEVPIHDAMFRATSQSGDTIAIAAMAWLPDPTPATVVVLVHGFSGVKENYFHTLPERGADLGGRLAETGRAVFALDMVGYGESYGSGAGATLDEQAFVLDQVTQAMRRGDYLVGGAEPARFEHAVAYGLSTGGLIIDIAQGRHGTFEAIMPAGASHKGPTSEFGACLRGDAACPEPPHDDFVVKRADPAVVNATIAGYEGDKAVSLASIMQWLFPCGPTVVLPEDAVPCDGPSPYDLNARNIDVPVLSILGTQDRIIDTSEAENEPSYFPNSPDARVLVLDGIGHFVHNHLIQPELVAQMDAFLDEQGV